MSVLNHKYKFIFMHEPHCGGRSFEQVLMTYEGSHNFNGEHHISVDSMLDKGWLTQTEFYEYYKFRFIRNPYEWLVTCWLSGAYRHTSLHNWVFEDGLKLIKNDTLFWRYTLADDTLYIDRRACKSLNSEFNRLGIPLIESLPHIGKTKDKPHWTLRFTIKEAIEIEKLYKDIIRYGYEVIK